jgi:membrane protease subunit HflK
MQEVYTNVTKVLVDTKSGSNLLYLPLDKLMQQSAQEATGTSPVAPAAASGAPSSAPVLPADARARDAERSRQRETR